MMFLDLESTMGRVRAWEAGEKGVWDIMGKDTSNQCRWLHDWGKWEFVENSNLAGETPNTRSGVVTTQCRECTRCGYTQTKIDAARA